MRRAFTALALLSLAALPQDAKQDDVSRWVSELGSDDVEKRNEAQKKLMEAGAPARDAVKALLATDDPEVKSRAAQILRDIDDRIAAGDILKAPVVKGEFRDATLESILAAWSEQTAFGIECEAPTRKIADFRSDGEPLLQALDRLCASAGDLTWSKNGAKRIRISAGTWIARPCAYAGPVRVSLVRVRETRTNDFEKNPAGNVSVWLRVESANGEKAWKDTIEANAAELPDKTALKVGGPAAEDNAGAWAGNFQVFVQGAVGGANAAEDAGREFVIRDVPRSADAIKGLAGSVELSIPIGVEDITVTQDDVNKTIEVGESKVRLVRWRNGQARIRITPKDFKDAGDEGQNGNVFVWSNIGGGGSNDLKEELERRVDLASIKGVENHGDARKLEGEIKGGRDGGNNVVIVGGAGGGNFQVDQSGGAPELVVDVPKDDSIEKITFKLKTRTYRQRLPFRISDIKLP